MIFEDFEDFEELRACCRDAAAFERLQQILLKAEADRQQKELQTRSLLKLPRQTEIPANSSPLSPKSSENLPSEDSLSENLPSEDSLSENSPSEDSLSENLPSEDSPSENSWVEAVSSEGLRRENFSPNRIALLPDAVTELRQKLNDRQWVEQTLLENEQRFRSLIENATDVIAVLDAAGIFRYCSPSAERILGYTPADVFGRKATEFVHPSDVELILGVLQAAIAQPRISQPLVEYWVRRKNGSWCIFEAVTTNLLDDPMIRGVVVNCHDITERKRSERGLQSANRRSFHILESITDAFIALDADGRFTYINGQAAQLFHRSAAELLGQNIWQALPEVANSLLPDRVDRSLKDQLSSSFEDFYPALDRWFEVRIFPAVDGLSIFFLDVSERKRAEATLRQQAERERLIGSIAQRIHQSLNLAEILNTAVAGVRQLLNTDRVVLCQYSPSREGQIVAESVRTGGESILGASFQIQPWYEDLQAYYRQGQSLVINDAGYVPQFPEMQAFLRIQGVTATIAVPILCGDQIWGSLIASQRSDPRHWESWEVALQEQLATQVAIALQQAELYHQVQQLNSQLEAQVQERTAQLQRALQFEATLKRITDSVRDSLDEDQILQTIVQELGTVLDVEACDVALHDLEHQTSTIRYEYIRSDLPSAKTAISMSLLPNIYQQILQEQYLQFCLLHPVIRPSQRHHTSLACPMMSDQGMLGDLWLFKPAEQIFTEAEIRLVQQVSNQGAIAIRQARLYQEAQAQVVALEELNQLKNDFLSTVSHELRTPISNMKIAIHMLRIVANPERQERYLSILQSECVREIELINDLLDLQRLEAAAYPVVPEAIPLRPFLLELVAPFQGRASDRQQHLSLQIPSGLPLLITDKAALERILSELLNNACKYTSPHGEIVLEVELGDRAGVETIAFSLRNQATIPAAALPKLFEKFYRVPNTDDWKQGGTGLGLALVQKLVGQLGGTIVPHSDQGWTTFTVQLPAATLGVWPETP